jgi:hypothetical protein
MAELFTLPLAPGATLTRDVLFAIIPQLFHHIEVKADA